MLQGYQRFHTYLILNKGIIENSMEKLTKKIIFITFALVLAGCSSSDVENDIDKIPDKPAQSLFVDARTSLDNGLYQKAIQILGAIDSRFPFGPVSHQVQLDLIYAYYKVGDAAQGLALTDRFLRLNPDNPNTDYVYYMRALINLSTEDNLFQDLAGIDRSDRDPTAAREAFNDFKRIVTDFPDSIYANDSQKRMRGRYIVEYFSPSPELEPALEIMIECYDKLGLDDLKKNALLVLAANYPNNSLIR